MSNDVCVFQYGKKVKNFLLNKYKKEDPLLTDEIITTYVNLFKIKQHSSKIVEKDVTRYSFEELKTLIDCNFPREISIDAFDEVYNDGVLSIYEADTKDKCIKYGKGEKWCISKRDVYNRFNTYRYRHNEINFYFVFDNERDDEFSKLVILVDIQNRYYFANRNNTIEFNGSKMCSWDDIIKYQPKLKDLKHIILPRKLKDDERKIYDLIKNKIETELFLTFKSYDIVESYIDYGYELNSSQYFNSLGIFKY